jgi:hypothetical protein
MFKASLESVQSLLDRLVICLADANKTGSVSRDALMFTEEA